MASAVGIVVAAFNAAQTIDQTLGSLAMQSRLPDQVVVVDDGSKDNTRAVAERWRAHLPLSVKLLGSNHGVGAARRAGVESLNTDLIAMLDADDYWLPDNLELLVVQYERNPGIVCSNALRWVPGEFLNLEPWQRSRPVPQTRDQLSPLFQRNFVFTSCLFSKSDYESAGGTNPELKIGEDWDLWMRMVANGVHVSALDTATMLYRITPGSLTPEASTADGELAVLTRNSSLASTPRQKRAFKRALAQRRSSLALQHAYEAARNGELAKARASAAKALRCNKDIRRRALAMLVAPKHEVALLDRRRLDPIWRGRT